MSIYDSYARGIQDLLVFCSRLTIFVTTSEWNGWNRNGWCWNTGKPACRVGVGEVEAWSAEDQDQFNRPQGWSRKPADAQTTN